MGEGGKIWTGTSGWTYDDWRGVVYPERRDVDALRFLSAYFDAVEINSTFYRPADPRHAEGWLEKTADNERFLFTAKLWRRFTHDKSARFEDETARVFARGLQPLAGAGKLGALLAQFSFAFMDGARARERLARIRDAFGSWPLVLEVRHVSWSAPEAVAFIRELGYSLAQTDQPRSSKSMPILPASAGAIGYVRLHGRSRAWFKKDSSRNEKYDYLYRPEQLQMFADLAKRTDETADKTFVFTNNHYRGQAAANALQLRFMLEGSRPSAPASLVEAYPELADFVNAEGSAGRQGTLL